MSDRGSAVVTGGAGFIGTHLIRRLREDGWRVTSIDINRPRKEIRGVEYRLGDVRDLAGSQFPKADRIYNLAAIHTTPGHADAEYYDTNVLGALEVTRCAHERSIQEIIFTSSISIYGPSELRLTERDTPAPVSAYGKSKLLAELIHRRWQTSAPGRRLVVVRPAVVFGEGEGGNFSRMAGLLRKGVFVFPGRRDTIKSCIHVDDLLDLIGVAQAETLIAGEIILNGAYPECPTLEDIVGLLKSAYFPGARMFDLPADIVKLVAKTLSTFNGLGLGLHPERVEKLTRSTHVYPEWAVARGLLPGQAFQAGVERWARSTDGKFV